MNSSLMFTENVASPETDIKVDHTDIGFGCMLTNSGPAPVVTFFSKVDWVSGTLTGGTFRIASPAGKLTLSGVPNFRKLKGATLMIQNGATVEMRGNLIQDPSTIINYGLVNIGTNGQIEADAGSLFENLGTVVKASGGQSNIGAAFVNGGPSFSGAGGSWIQLIAA